MYETYKGQADIFVVYIAEAHAVDGWQTTSNEDAGIRVKQHTTFAERLDATRLCAQKLQLTIPMLVDGMDDAANKAFSAWPERLYIIYDGKIQYKGGPGPYEFNVEESTAALVQLLQDIK